VRRKPPYTTPGFSVPGREDPFRGMSRCRVSGLWLSPVIDRCESILSRKCGRTNIFLGVDLRHIFGCGDAHSHWPTCRDARLLALYVICFPVVTGRA
jgi:hypothetical protein